MNTDDHRLSAQSRANVQPSNITNRIFIHYSRGVFSRVFREEELEQIKIAVETSRTCQITSELSQVSAEVIKLNLSCQEDVLRFRKWEHTLVCAGVLVEYNQKQNITV